MQQYRKFFPMLKKVTYLDNAALLMKPLSVIEAGTDYYTNYCISPRTSDSKLGVIVNQRIENTRAMIAEFVDAQPQEVIFTSGTTESLNLFAQMALQFLKPNDEILISAYNHSSNIIPWIEVAQKTDVKIIYSENIVNDITSKTKIVALSQITNNFNQNFDMKKINQLCQKNHCLVVNDAAQAVYYEKVSLKNSDVIAFSSNKLYGPTGLGFLVVKKNLLKKLEPTRFGGGSVSAIKNEYEWLKKNGIAAYEPGTPNVAAIWQMESALNFIKTIDYPMIQQYLKELANYLYDQLLTVKNIEIASQRGDSITMFNIKNITSQDVASYLGHKDIYVRAGTFCAKLIDHVTKRNSYVRVSLAIYNTKADIDILVNALKQGGDFLEFI
ncbi:aminotransferase class V-fold PLP-dependent enzyme [Candidatus Mycoplasma pogonae]